MVMVMLMPLPMVLLMPMPNKPSKSEKKIESVMAIKNAGQARV
jgi:hypothetical protein